MRVLVTGGAGYLGSSLVPLLLGQGHTVRVYDRFCFGEDSLKAVKDHPACEIIRGDIRRLQETPGLLDGIEAIVHLASLSNDPSCDLDHDMTHDVNIESTRELAKKAVQQGVRRFVFASSCNVYGKGVFDALDEESPPNPVSAFGSSKLEGERIVLGMKSAFFEPVVARTATMFGCSPRMRFDVAVNHMVATALRTGGIKVLGGGGQWRPFIHVRDAARALILLLEASAGPVSGQIFNVGADALNCRILDLARQVAEAIGSAGIEVAKDDDDLRTYRVQFGKIRDIIGFHPEYTISDGIGELRKAIEGTSLDPFAEAHSNVRRMKKLLATPVDEGGEPIAARFVSVLRPCLGDEEEAAVIEALRSGWLTSGPQVQAFEKAFAETVASPHAIAVSSCTAALHLCLAALGVKPGDEVITSPLTWASTGNTILNMGAKVAFADIRPGSLNINPEAVERAITPRTRAIIPVDMAGLPCDLDAIHAIARRHGIPVIEDAAHALGAAYKGTPIGAYSDYTCFSFYAIKNITTMEGGAITVKEADMAARLRRLAANGMADTAWDRYGRSAVAHPSEVVEPGYKYLLGNVGAAMGVEQLKKFAQFKAARRRLAHMYRTALEGIDEIRLPETSGESDHAWHLFIIRFRLDRLAKTRDELAAALRRENIGTAINFFGLHLHRYYREALGMRPEDFPEATAASFEVLSLPLHPGMTDKNVHEVAEALKKVLAHARKTG